MPRVTTRGVAAILMVAGICALPIAIYAPFFNEPFMRDEGIYAAVAQIIKHGGVPYRDAFDDKPPLLFGWYYLSFLLFGEHLWAPRLFVALLLSGTTALMYVEGRLLYSHRYGVIAAFAFASSLAIVRLETSANAEWFMIPPLVAALVTFTLGQKTGRWEWYAASGLFSGAAIATKECALFAFLLFVWIAGWPLVKAHGMHALKMPAFWRSVGGLVAGLTAAFLLVIAPFAATGTIPDVFEGTVVWAVLYIGGGPLLLKARLIAGMPFYLTLVLGPWFILAVLGFFQLRKASARPASTDSQLAGTLVAGWLVAGFVGIVAVGKFYDHYYATLLPSIALIIPKGVEFVSENWRSFGQKRWLPLTITMAVVLPIVMGGQIATNAGTYLKPTVEGRHIAKYHGDYHSDLENRSPAIAAWLAARTQPDDPIWNFGFQSEIYFYADRRSPSRFLMDRPFWYTDKYIDQALVELNANKPIYVVDTAIYEAWQEEDDSNYTYRVKDWIVANYDYIGKVEYADVWRLKAADE